MLTYQLAYWAWMKLETDEVRAETDSALSPPPPPPPFPGAPALATKSDDG